MSDAAPTTLRDETTGEQTQPGAPGTLFLVSAPSGAGKTTLVRALTAGDQRIRLSVSHTTRPRRPNEANGVHYHFVTDARFRAMVDEDAFLEHAHVFGNLYGTSRGAVLEGLQAGFDVILEIDWQGARQVRSRMPEAVGIFILPPSRASLEERLRGRAEDDEAVIEARLAKAVEEMSHHAEFDYLVVNDDVEEALADLRAVIRAERLRHAKQALRRQALLGELLENDAPTG